MFPPWILVIGSANLDLIMSLNRLPRPGETVTDGMLSQAWGGKGANAAVGAARAGGRVQFVGCVGDDAQGSQLVAALQDAGVAASAVRQIAGVATGTALILLDAAGSNMIAVAPGANEHLHPEDVQALADQFASAAMIVVQYEIPTATLRAALDLAVQLKRPTLFNFAPVRPLPAEDLAKVHLLVVNEVEAAALWGQPVVSVAQ
ncbi:MAG: PfkB family carbohydrate kinase, partial [Oscillochloridaceae bacterium umkhey_bin13]